MKEIRCSSLDDWIMKTYDYVKTTGHKVSYQYNYKELKGEYHSTDGTIFYLPGNLARRTVKNSKFIGLNTPMTEIINRQLLAFI